MEKLKYLAAFTGHIIRTVTGFYYRPFGKAWDECLQQILSEGVITSVDRYTVTFWHHGNTYEIWISDRWHAYGFLHYLNERYITSVSTHRPRFRTMYRLHQMVQTHLALAKEV